MALTKDFGFGPDERLVRDQARKFLRGLGGRTPLPLAQPAHVQAGADALAGFPAQGLG